MLMQICLTCQDHRQQDPIIFFSATWPGDEDGLPRVGALLGPYLVLPLLDVKSHDAVEE